MKPVRKTQDRSNAGTFLALFTLMAVTLGLLFLAVLVMPQFVGVLIVGAAFMLMIVFHYCVWGWWLGRNTALEETDPRDRWPEPPAPWTGED